MAGHSVERTHPTVVTVRFDHVSSGWEQWLLLRSDAHHDSRFCDHGLEKKHLDQVLERDALILDCGDIFDAMQGKWDRRKDKSDLIPELQTNRYLDDVVTYCADFYEPYARRWVLMSEGNHETAVLKNHETHLTQRLVATLNDRTGSTIQAGKYSGWVRFMFTINGTSRLSKKLRYTHGYGGGGPVTRGVISSNREAVFLGGADIVWSGHTHDDWEVPIMRERLSSNGTPIQDEMLFIKTPGYKNEWASGDGFAHEKLGARGPKPLGARWVRLYHENIPGRGAIISIETIRAK